MTRESWHRLIAEASALLGDAGVTSPTSDARELAEFAAGVRRLPAADPTPDERAMFSRAVARRAAREPLQHITGRMYFRWLELVSRPGAFIVRPETEAVAQDAVDEARRIADRGERPRVLDLCTGSGAIALAVATEVPASAVVGVDASAEALQVARENNAAYGGPVEFVLADALEFSCACEPDVHEDPGASESGAPESGGARGKFDVVVANPPYVPARCELSPEVLADPAAALWGGGEDGLDMPNALVVRAAGLLKPGGLLVMEHAEEQAEPLRRLALKTGFVKAETRADLAGRPRWLRARLPLDEH